MNFITRPQVQNLKSRNRASESTELCVTRVFSFIIISPTDFDDRLSSNFHRLVILCICWDTPSERTGLWQLVQQGRFCFHCALIANLTTNWAQIFTGLLCYAYFEIHQEWTLVFDNYQACPVSLNQHTIAGLMAEDTNGNCQGIAFTVYLNICIK